MPVKTAKKTTKKAAKPQMFTAAKAAQELGASASAVKKAITNLGIKPDERRGRCSYYSPATLKKIKKGLKS